MLLTTPHLLPEEIMQQVLFKMFKDSHVELVASIDSLCSDCVNALKWTLNCHAALFDTSSISKSNLRHFQSTEIKKISNRMMQPKIFFILPFLYISGKFPRALAKFIPFLTFLRVEVALYIFLISMSKLLNSMKMCFSLKFKFLIIFHQHF